MERLDILSNKLQNPEWDDIGQVIIDSVMTNFEVGGRPGWKPDINPMSGKPMIKTGNLKNTYVINKGKDFIMVSWTQPYGAVHQSLATARPKVSPKSHNYFLAKLIDARRNKTPDLEMWKGLYKKKIGDTINIPERRFAKLQQDDINRIISIFEEQIQWN